MSVPLVFPLLLSSVPLSVLPSCSSYFSLLPRAHRSVPDGNSLRLQEPPWRPHGGGTGGEQSGPVLPDYPSPVFAPMYFFPFFSLFLTHVSSLRSPCVLYPAYQATQVLRVTCSWLGSLSTEPSPHLLYPPAPFFPPLSPFLLQCSPQGQDSEAIQSRAVHQPGCLLAV